MSGASIPQMQMHIGRGRFRSNASDLESLDDSISSSFGSVETTSFRQDSMLANRAARNFLPSPIASNQQIAPMAAPIKIPGPRNPSNKLSGFTRIPDIDSQSTPIWFDKVTRSIPSERSVPSWTESENSFVYSRVSSSATQYSQAHTPLDGFLNAQFSQALSVNSSLTKPTPNFIEDPDEPGSMLNGLKELHVSSKLPDFTSPTITRAGNEGDTSSERVQSLPLTVVHTTPSMRAVVGFAPKTQSRPSSPSSSPLKKPLSHGTFEMPAFSLGFGF